MAKEHIISELQKNISKVEEDYSLKGFNPLSAGGVADYFTIASTTIELATAVKSAIDLSVPYLIIGKGSKTLFSDSGFPGLVIHNQARSYGIAKERSQIVVDSGLSLSQIVTAGAGQGLGGLSQFYGTGGTIGGALYNNSSSDDRSIISMLKYVTVIMPPKRLDKEATIVRYKKEWLQTDSGETRLQKLRIDSGVPSPVILTALLQLSHLRSDEIMSSINLYDQKNRIPSPRHMGPLFMSNLEVPINDLLRGSQASRLRVGSIYVDKNNPNFLLAGGKGGVRSLDIKELIEQMQEMVQKRYAVDLFSRYEYVGVW